MANRRGSFWRFFSWPWAWPNGKFISPQAQALKLFFIWETIFFCFLFLIKWLNSGFCLSNLKFCICGGDYCTKNRWIETKVLYNFFFWKEDWKSGMQLIYVPSLKWKKLIKDQSGVRWVWEEYGRLKVFSFIPVDMVSALMW